MNTQTVRKIGVSRRGFLGSVFSAGALVLTSRVLENELFAAPDAANAAWHPSVYLGIETDGTVILVTHRSEMGTGIRTSLPLVAADELEADWKRVKIEQGQGNAKYGNQNTDGSRSIVDFYDAFRSAGASARTMLERAAAQKWGVPAEQCKAKNHFVVHAGTNRQLGFGELATLAAQQAVPKKEELKLKTNAELRYVGHEMPTADLADECTGKAIFGMDAKVPGMVYASIERSPVLGGKLKSYDDKAALAVGGVKQTVVIDAAKPPFGFQALGGVAVIADNTWSAMQGRQKLKIEWEPGEHGSYDSQTYKKLLLETARTPQRVVRTVGNVDNAFSAGGKTHEADYYVPLLAHAPMEPPVAVAEYKDGKVTAWTATQNPQAVQDTVAAAVGVKKEDVICNVTLLGGGFGRKSKPDYVAEAAILSKKIGKPVKVVWTREDDVRFDYYHSVAGMYVKAALDGKGRPTAWLQRSAFPPIAFTLAPNQTYGGAGEMGMGWVDMPFDIPNLRIENGPAQGHVRIGWLRSVANIYHAFAVQSFVDELAHQAKRDSVEYLLDVLGSPRKIDFAAEKTNYTNYGKTQAQYPVDTGRMRKVIELAAEQSGWAKKKPSKGRALGIAAHRSFLSYVAVVADVEVAAGGKVRVHRMDIAVDAGRTVNPDRVRSQFEGAGVFGTSIALMGEITAANGQIQQSNFHNYPVARMNEAPYETHVHVIASEEPPGGVGEPGVPPVAPAICNAIFAATGKRIRELPIKKQLA